MKKINNFIVNGKFSLVAAATFIVSVAVGFLLVAVATVNYPTWVAPAIAWVVIGLATSTLLYVLWVSRHRPWRGE